jgi:hypothetical protein
MDVEGQSSLFDEVRISTRPNRLIGVNRPDVPLTLPGAQTQKTLPIMEAD